MSSTSRGGPAVGPGGQPLDVDIASGLVDRGQTPTLRENLALGIGKAHRSVVYSHYDYRNRRENLGSSGKVSP